MKYLKILIALIIFCSLFFVVKIEDLISSFKEVTLTEFSILMLVSIVLVWISAIKWQIFLEFFGEKRSTFKLFSYYLIGYFVNLIVPSYIGGDVVRSLYASKSKTQGILSTILERLTGLIAMVTLGVVFVNFTPIVQELKLTIFIIAGVILLGLIPIFSDKFFNIFTKLPVVKKFKPKLEQVKTSLVLAKNNYPLLFKTFSLSYLFHFVTVINVLTVAYAIGWFEVPIMELFVILPVVLLIGAIPITPSGLGLQEGAFFFTLTKIGATNEQALAIAVILRLKTYVLAAMGGIFFLLQKKASHSKQVPAEI